MTDGEEDFATLFEASLKAKRFERGQLIEGKIVAIRQDVAFVDVGGKGEAAIDIEELRNDDGTLEVAAGDRIQAMVVSTEGGLKLSRKLARRAASERELESAFETGLPVEGKVERAVKGGLEVRIGRLRGFCPISQIDAVRTDDPSVHEGRVYSFRIVEFRDGGKNLVVSRRALLEEEQRASAAELRRSIAPGAVMTGRVVSVREFGAFVDLGSGVQGLLHISEMGWSRVSKASEVVQPGDSITVKVLRVDDDGQKIALTVKQLTGDPWSRVLDTYAVGQVRTGRITRLADFGAFVELEPGVEGLAHVSTFPPTGRSESWSRSLTTGMTAPFEILSIDFDKKRIGVALAPDGSARASSATAVAPAIAPGVRLTGQVERHEKFGVFVYLAPGRTGLIPMSETGVARDADIAKVFPIGGDVEVMVLEVDAASRRISLSRKAIFDAQEAEVVREYTERSDAASAQQFGGTLADKLRGALKPRDP